MKLTHINKCFFYVALLVFSLQLNAAENENAFSIKKIQKHVLKKLISEALSEQKEAEKVGHALIDENYESEMRGINTRKYGMAFPLQPEILFDLGKGINGKRVLEIAGARGENGIILGLMGAKTVDINDIDEVELKHAKDSIEKLPLEIQKKFKVIRGDCFKIFDKKSYDGRYDLIVARNIFHFLKKEKAKEFVALISRLLAPDGKLFLSANSVAKSIPKELLEENKDCTVFRQEILMVRVPDKKNYPCHRSMVIEENPDESDPFGYRFRKVGTIGFEGYELTSGELTSSQTGILKHFLSTNSHMLLTWAISEATVEVHESHITAFTEITLVREFEKLLKKENVGHIGVDGHLCTKGSDAETFIYAIFSKE